MHTLMAGVQTADAQAGIRQPTSSWFCALRECVPLAYCIHMYSRYYCCADCYCCCSYASLITTSLPLCRATPPHMPSRLLPSLLTADVGARFLAFYQPDITTLPAPSIFILPYFHRFRHTIQHTSPALRPVGSQRASARRDKPITAG
jgi:hypothetical protein